MSNSTVGPLWTISDADRRLAGIAAERDRISAALLGMESNPTRRLLESGSLSGDTRILWAAAKAAYGSLWQWFSAYSTVVDEAQRTRGLRARPGEAELRRLAWLLAGDSAELPGDAAAGAAQPTLSGVPIPAQRVSLAALVQRMDKAYADVAEVVNGAEAVWTALLSRLDRIDQARQAAEMVAREVDPGMLDLLRDRRPDRRGAVAARRRSVVIQGLKRAGNSRLEEIRAGMATGKAIADDPIADRMKEIRAQVARERDPDTA